MTNNTPDVQVKYVIKDNSEWKEFADSVCRSYGFEKKSCRCWHLLPVKRCIAIAPPPAAPRNNCVDHAWLRLTAPRANTFPRCSCHWFQTSAAFSPTRVSGSRRPSTTLSYSSWPINRHTLQSLIRLRCSYLPTGLS